MSQYLSAAETAKLIRAALKSNFPGIKFSVRSKSYSGGASIDVGWTDGPTAKEVDGVVGIYQGATFDGMRDLKEYHSTLLAGPDGLPREVRFGADFVFTRRAHSATFLRLVAEQVAALWRLPVPEIKQWQDGSAWFDPYNTARLDDHTTRTVGDEIYHMVGRCAFVDGQVVEVFDRYGNEVAA